MARLRVVLVPISSSNAALAIERIQFSSFPPLLNHLSRKIPGLGAHVAQALENNDSICSERPQIQFQQLLPLDLLQVAVESNMIIVVDALDESDRPDDLRVILHRLATAGIRLFATSRHDPPIQRGIRVLHETLWQETRLEQVPTHVMEHDLRVYMTHSLNEIRINHNLSHSSTLPMDWGKDKIEQLVQIALPLFIVAYTMCRYIKYQDPQTGLADVLRHQDEGRSLTGYDAIYVPVLRHVVCDLAFGHGQDKLQKLKRKETKRKALQKVQRVIGPIVLLADTLSGRSLSNIIRIPLADMEQILQRLQSVLHVPDLGTDSHIRLCHQSFRDFLINPEHNKFGINEPDVHAQLAAQCLSLLDHDHVLHDDMLHQVHPGIRRTDISLQEVTKQIPSDVAYACRFWIWHYVQSGDLFQDVGTIHDFFTRHLLHWLETLTWLGQLSHAMNQIARLRESLGHVSPDPPLTSKNY